MEANTTGVRIVSMGAYARAQVKRFLWWVEALVFCGAASLCLLIVLCFAGGVLRFAPSPVLRDLVTTDWVWLLLFFPVFIYLCSAAARWCLSRSRTIETGVPALLRTASLLPAPSSLVRASAEPMQLQQGVLLRSAQVQPQHEEQLVRAVGG